MQGDLCEMCAVNLAGSSFQPCHEYTLFCTERTLKTCHVFLTSPSGVSRSPDPPSKSFICSVPWWHRSLWCFFLGHRSDLCCPSVLLLAAAASGSFSLPCYSCLVPLATRSRHCASLLSFWRWRSIRS